MVTKINDLFLPLYTSKKRYYLVVGGRGSLKSTTVHDFIARLSYEVGHGILILRYTMTSAEKSVIPEFKSCLERLEIESDFEISGTKITNTKTGSFILFAGIKTSSGNQTANLKSLHGITTVVIEEGEDFVDEKAFDAIDDSVRAVGVQNRIIWIQNPTTREHFIYKRWIEPKNKTINRYGYDVTVSNMDNVEHIHTTYHIAEDLGYLNSSFIDKAETYKKDAERKEILEKGAKYKSHYYYNYIGGWKERADGTVFNYLIGDFNDKLPLRCLHLDWGYNPDPLAVGEIAIDTKQKKIYVREILYSTMVNDVPTALLNAGVNKRDLIICDTSEPRTKTSVQNKGFNIQNAVKGLIKDDIREISQYEIILDPNSPNYKIELDNYVWNDKKASVPIDKYNHLLDGMRYGFNRLTKKNSFTAAIGSPQLF